MNPAIVISAYNRPQALQRLLDSLARIQYIDQGAIPLIISIDHAESHPEVVKIAQKFQWQYGSKEIILHEKQLGPIGHFYACGNLAEDLGTIVYLEDDLVVSPVFYSYAHQALSFFGDDERIGGFSLYSLWFNGYTQEPFTPLSDDADSFFIQLPYTQGQIFTGEQWQRFRTWRLNEQPDDLNRRKMHPAWFHFRSDEWFPVMARYLISTGRYYVFPRVSQTSGFGDAGTHFDQATGFFQAPLQREKQHYTFKPLDDSLAVYDSFFEILPERLNRMAPFLSGYEYTVDLYGNRTRQNILTDYVLTSRPCLHPILSFGKTMHPMEVNIEQVVPGKGISLCRTPDLRWDRISELELRQSNYDYFTHGKQLGEKAKLQYGAIRVYRKVRDFFRVLLSDLKDHIRKPSSFWKKV